jgi:hypothetical protein
MRKPPRSDRPAVSTPAASPASTDSQRRRFLFTLGVSGAGAAAASVAAIPAVAAETDTTGKDEDGRYQESTHVRNYYRTTRI